MGPNHLKSKQTKVAISDLGCHDLNVTKGLKTQIGTFREAF